MILNDTRFFSTSFAVHCWLVWCVGLPQSFFTVHDECGSTFVESLSQKKKSTHSEILFDLSSLAFWPIYIQSIYTLRMNYILEASFILSFIPRPSLSAHCAPVTTPSMGFCIAVNNCFQMLMPCYHSHLDHPFICQVLHCHVLWVLVVLVVVVVMVV